MENKAKKIAIGIGLAIALAVGIVVYLCDPQGAWWMPKCVFHSLTGLQCPGCGFTRALHALLHGHPLQALRYNYFFIISLPLLAAVAFTAWSDGKMAARLRPIAQGRAAMLAYIVLFFIWWIVRNVLGI